MGSSNHSESAPITKDEAVEKLNAEIAASEKEAEASPYQAVEIRFTDNEGNVKAFAQMYVKDMLTLEKLYGFDRTDTLAMLFKASEEDLIKRQNGSLQDDKSK